MLAKIGKRGPKHDYRGAHVIDRESRLATIVDVRRSVHGPLWIAKLRRFNGEDAGEQSLETLEILERTYEEA